MDQQGSPCYHNFLLVTLSYHSKVNHVNPLYAEKLAEAGYLYVSIIGFPASLLSPSRDCDNHVDLPRTVTAKTTSRVSESNEAQQGHCGAQCKNIGCYSFRQRQPTLLMSHSVWAIRWDIENTNMKNFYKLNKNKKLWHIGKVYPFVVSL